MIKWEHSIFALPFAPAAPCWPPEGLPCAQAASLDRGGHGGARSAAMAFNRVVDAEHRRGQSRAPAVRAMPAGVLSEHICIQLCRVSPALFWFWRRGNSTGWRSGFRRWHSRSLLLYSYTKRFTRWSHLVLGFALGVAPAAAWIAVKGILDLRILLLTFAVTFWVAGFDVLYACQDIEFDRAARLYSLPCSFGVKKSLDHRPRAAFHHVPVFIAAGAGIRIGEDRTAWNRHRRVAAGL